MPHRNKQGLTFEEAKEKILDYILDFHPVDAQQIAKHMGFTTQATPKYLSALIKDGLIQETVIREPHSNGIGTKDIKGYMPID